MTRSGVSKWSLLGLVVLLMIAGGWWLAGWWSNRGYQIDAADWRWSKQKASLGHSIEQHLQDYEVEFVRENDYYSPINIRTKDDRRVVYSLDEGHRSIVFTRLRNVLFIAEFSPIATGCDVVAFDLARGRQLWRSHLQGIGSTCHSKYKNRVNIDTDGKRIIVMGNEAHGRYIEHLDINTGKTLANTKLDPDLGTLWNRD